MVCNKVIKIALICDQIDKDGKDVNYNDIYKLLWDLQKQTREAKNKVIRLCWEWSGYSSEYFKTHEEYPKDKEIFGISLRGYLYDRIKGDYNLYSGNLSQSAEIAYKEYKNSLKDVLREDKSIINYRENQPLDIKNKAIQLLYENDNFFVRVALINKDKQKELNFKDCSVRFKLLVKDDSTRTILERCFDEVYTITASKIMYNKKKKQWYINLGYKFTKEIDKTLDKDRILGVDLGVINPLVASVYGSYDRLIIGGGEIDKFRKRVEANKVQMLKQGKYCGDGRIGHGVNTRNKPAYNIEDKISRFRDTVNHKYSKAVVDYAVKNNCGTIQMEDLKGITQNKNERYLKNWTYFDLQTKIEYKAKALGIEVKYKNPKYTSQRCSKCGHIAEENRPEQKTFKCVKCGFKVNADYNASQNLAIKDIDKIIEQYYNKG